MTDQPLRAILYCRVSSEEQVRGYSLNQQEEALREHAASEGWEVLEVVRDEGHSGAYLERPGLDRVRDLMEAGGVSVVVSQDADRITRDPAHRMLLDEEFDRRGCKLEALDDWGDNTHEGQLLKFLKGWVSKGERLKIAERTRRGRRQKAKQGLLVAPSTVAYGFVPNPKRDGYLVDERTMPVVRRAFQMIADGAGISGAKGAFEREGVPTPTGGRLWSRSTLRDLVTKDVYFPHTYEEVAALVSPQVAAGLDREKAHGVWWASRHDWKVVERVKRPDGQYRDRRRHTEKPREEWIAVPVPDAGIPREVAERARRNVERNFAPPKRQHGLGGRRGRAWELAGGLAVCGAEGCGRRMIGHTVAPAKRKKAYHYYLCPKKSEGDWKTACPNRNHRAADLEARVRDFVTRLLEDPDTLREQVEQQVRAEREAKPWLRDAGEARAARERLAKLEVVADNYRDQQAEGLITIDGLREKLDGIAGERNVLEARLAMLAGGEERLRELDSLPGLVDAYLRDLPELVGQERIVREYETVPAERTEANPLGAYTLTPESIRHLPEEELAQKRLEAEDARAVRFREIYAMIGLQVAVHPSDALDISLGANAGSGPGSKGVMPWDESG